MPKIVNKEERRKEIALSCKELFIEKGINALTIAEVAKTAGIGKGTVYEYFENKDDIIFEIVEIMVTEKDKRKEELLEKATTTKEKIKTFFYFFYDEEYKELRKLYKEFVSISLVNPNEVLHCQKADKDIKYYNWFKSILEEGVNSGELKPESLKLAKGLYALGGGFFITHNTSNLIQNMEEEMHEYIDALFELIEVKK